ncbi:hypothetical protein MRB53_001812 [Persea americana]|uniref:Uncharacterized protein n=1 Tax=Persea americana TaxID=3435 RepID=A0ACC2MSW5_PERAE|nr:hypothetical protein MRB53_001812 [Persea americana]
MLSLQSLLLVLSILSISLFFVFSNKTPSKKPNGSVFVTYPIIGNLPLYLKNRYRWLEWQTEVLGEQPTNTITFRRPGSVPGVITASPANVEHILKTNFPNYPKGELFITTLEDFLGEGIFNVDGELWMFVLFTYLSNLWPIESSLLITGKAVQRDFLINGELNRVQMLAAAPWPIGPHQSSSPSINARSADPSLISDPSHLYFSQSFSPITPRCSHHTRHHHLHPSSSIQESATASFGIDRRQRVALIIRSPFIPFLGASTAGRPHLPPLIHPISTPSGFLGFSSCVFPAAGSISVVFSLENPLLNLPKELHDDGWKQGRNRAGNVIAVQLQGHVQQLVVGQLWGPV